MEKTICPFLSMGWLANKFAADGQRTFNLENLPECKEAHCRLWDKNTKVCKLGR